MRYLYLPVVKVQRDLDAKLLLALKLAQSSPWRVIISTVSWIRRAYQTVPPGAILWGTSRTGLVDINSFRSFGHRVIGLCEEGLVWDERVYRHRKMHSDALDQLDAFFAWGEAQAQIANDVAPGANTLAAGNPRLDLLTDSYRRVHAREAERAQDLHNNYVLVVSRGSNFLNSDYRNRLVKKREETFGLDVDWQAYYSNLAQNWFEMADLAEQLALEFSERTIVFRPKFNEDVRFVMDYFRDAPSNLRIVGSGNIQPLILGAAATISRHCTTMVEAELVGTPNVCVDTIPWTDFRIQISDECFPHLRTHDAALRRINALLHGQAAPSAASTPPTRFCEAFNGEVSIDVIVRYLNSSVPSQSSAHYFVSGHQKILMRQKIRSFVGEVTRRRARFEEGFRPNHVISRLDEMAQALETFSPNSFVDSSSEAIIIG